MYEIKTFSVEHVREADTYTLNTNNIKLPDGSIPSDYLDKANEVSTENWIDLLHPGKSRILKIDEADIGWMIRANKFDMLRTGWLRVFKEEFEYMCEKYAPVLKELIGERSDREQREPERSEGGRKRSERGERSEPGKWFVRTSQYSLKYSGYFQPLTGDSIEPLIKGLVSFVRGHSGVNDFMDSGKDKLLFFLPWQNINPDHEFRIFVKDQKITAISQQKLFRVNTWLCRLSSLELEKVIDNILEEFYLKIRSKLEKFNDYVLDFTFIRNSEGELIGYPIEINQFGQEYGAGSALYEWTADHDLLYGLTNNVGFRFVDRKN